MTRLYNHKTDYQGVKDYCFNHGIAFPDRNSVLIVSFNNQGNVNGLVGLKPSISIEPLIADNPILANTLGRMIEGVIIAEGIKIVQEFLLNTADSILQRQVERTKITAPQLREGRISAANSASIRGDRRLQRISSLIALQTNEHIEDWNNLLSLDASSNEAENDE